MSNKHTMELFNREEQEILNQISGLYVLFMKKATLSEIIESNFDRKSYFLKKTEDIIEKAYSHNVDSGKKIDVDVLTKYLYNLNETAMENEGLLNNEGMDYIKKISDKLIEGYTTKEQELIGKLFKKGEKTVERV